MEFIGLLYLLGFIALVILVGALILAPIKLYAIARECEQQTQEMRLQTGLLRVMAKVPAEGAAGARR